MVNREKLHKILTLVLEITERGQGENGYPYVSIDINNYSRTIHLYAIKNGFSEREYYDINTTIDSDSDADKAIEELEKLLKIAVDRIGEQWEDLQKGIR